MLRRLLRPFALAKLASPEPIEADVTGTKCHSRHCSEGRFSRQSRTEADYKQTQQRTPPCALGPCQHHPSIQKGRSGHSKQEFSARISAIHVYGAKQKAVHNLRMVAHEID